MSVQKLMYKWWKDDDRYIQDPWTEITLLHDELKQMAITESALREFLTKLSQESNEYRHKIETENAELKKENALLRVERDLLLYREGKQKYLGYYGSAEEAGKIVENYNNGN